MELFAQLGNWIGGVMTLAKDIGKGGGGSAEEPTVCMTLLPLGLGVAFVALRSLRRTTGSGQRRSAV